MSPRGPRVRVRTAGLVGVVLGLAIGMVAGIFVGGAGAPAVIPSGAEPETTLGPDAGRPAVPRLTPEPSGPRWLSPAGRNDASGTLDDPLRDPQAALDAGATTLHLAAGTYDGFTLTRSGVEVLGPPGGGARIEGRIRIEGVRDVRIREIEIAGVDDPYTAGLRIDRSERVIVERVHATGNTFGIQLRDVERVTIADSRFTHNGAGVEIHGRARDVTVRGSVFERNDRAVDDSRGANGINLFRATGPITIADNIFRSNFNPDPEPGTDAGGGAIEVYATSDVTITGNEITDSSVMETGTEDDIPCARILFTRNVAYRGPRAPVQDGLVLRCAEDSLVAHNTFDGMDDFAFDLIHEAGPFGGSIAGLRILNNIVTRGRAYSIDNRMPSSVVIDHNLVWNPDSPAQMGQFVAYMAGRGNTTSTEEMRTWGLDPNGVSGDPRYVDGPGGDLRVQADSPAIDAGVVIPGVNDDLPDGRPDIGRWEAAP